tara:strand:- start:141 stop:1205 length:1065 start_codon:yes stop_codon:yes gene_type:complete
MKIYELENIADVNYGTRVVKSRDSGTMYDVYGGGGKTFKIDSFNREDCVIVSRFGMSEECVRKVNGKFFLNDSGLSVETKDTNKVIQKYIDWFLFSKMFDIYLFGRGAAQKNLDVNKFRLINIPVPSLQEQEKIVERLDGVLEVINKSNLVNSKRKIDKFKFIKSYFAYKEENIEFEIKTLPEISINLDSKRKPIKKSLRVKGDVPYYGATGLIDYVEDFIFDEELLLISEDGANLIDRKYPIAFSINGKSWVNNHAHVMKFNDKILQKYIMYYFNFLDISKHVTGAAQPKLNQKRLNKIEIPVPKFEKDLNDIVETFKNINIKISLLNKNLAKSNILFDQLEKSILKKEFSYE